MTPYPSAIRPRREVRKGEELPQTWGMASRSLRRLRNGAKLDLAAVLFLISLQRSVVASKDIVSLE